MKGKIRVLWVSQRYSEFPWWPPVPHSCLAPGWRKAQLRIRLWRQHHHRGKPECSQIFKANNWSILVFWNSSQIISSHPGELRATQQGTVWWLRTLSLEPYHVGESIPPSSRPWTQTKNRESWIQLLQLVCQVPGSSNAFVICYPNYRVSCLLEDKASQAGN